MWRMLFPRWICFLACASVWMEARVRALPRITYSHAGICPNDMNPNLWVDAMSTCTRECESDQECEPFEKCCQNVCGTRSCVAARYVDGNKGPVGMPDEATCASFMCPQQGSECDVWDGQPVCKCRDRCEREPHFTCASDGMTYYNKCYMDAEACSKGVVLTVVTCRFHLTWPNTSPALPRATTPGPTTAPQATSFSVPPAAPVLVGGPTLQTVSVGDTASFLCDVTGAPRPDVTWEKRLPEGAERVVMSPNHVRGNMVVTNIGQLVIYNAQPRDSGVYTCTARNPSGSVRADHPLAVLPPDPRPAEDTDTRCPPAGCVKPPDDPRGCGSELEKVSWYFEANNNSCLAHAHCHGGGEVMETHEECMRCCGPELSGPCGLPSLQGPCKAYEPRWAYSGALRQCRSFIYGGCEGNGNNFESREACEEACPHPTRHRCKACKPRGKMVASFCRSDFAIVGRMTDVTEERDSGHALVAVEEILKDDKMGLRFLGHEPLEVTFVNVDWSCPCPNVTGAAAEGPLIVMGDARDGVAVIQPESYVGASSPRRVRKLRELASKSACDILKAMTPSPE
ncbi:WAP, Kazal, immunoglobulin, Kunitz and NTR domain-containing protein 2-like [Betta splendens]|uniref:WAP, Kazal, immunoglobulin, Kunitz and NTR domain-containing protein 2-like n=1 Tax=Betta splendens TaxID=158456 RepID=UPI0010F56BD0|nr:WAP, Kazal, immunoglobulin, Kunitz and NTR domain-containing protein 2-like [Betta splendens]